MESRICKQCHTEKPIEEFGLYRKWRPTRRRICKQCAYARTRKYKSEHREDIASYNMEYRLTHQEEIEINKARYNAEHRKESCEYGREYRRLNPEKVIASQVAYRTENKDKIREASRERYAKDPEKYRTQAQTYRTANPEHTKELQKNRYERNPEYYCAMVRNWYANNSQHVKVRSRAYRLANPAIIKANKASYRARKRQAPINDLTAAQWEDIKVAFDHRCAYCKRKMQRLTQDHIVPLSKGGSHTASNIVPACAKCNSTKGDGPPPIPVQPLLLTIAPPKKQRGT